MGGLVFAAFLSVTLLVNQTLHVDKDDSPRGSPDPWTSIDKVAHFLGGYALCLSGVTLAGLPAYLALPLVVAFGVVWELTQKYHSPRDMAVTAAGAIVAALMVTYL